LARGSTLSPMFNLYREIHMKKTLVALAVLAASGASFAQVTITGNLTMGYQAKTTGGINGAGASDASGLGVDTSQIDFAATEDLGGGMKATAKMSLAGADRSNEGGTAVAGRDASLTLTTGMGAFQLASAQAADYLSGGLAGVGSYYSGFDGKVLSPRSNRDIVNYILPVGAWTLAATYQESANLQGLGKGTTGSSAETGQSLTGVSASYAAGKLAANFTYLQFNAQTGAVKNQTRLSGNYDLGAAKIGAGAVVTQLDSAYPLGVVGGSPRTTDLLIAATVPMGAVTFGAEFVSRNYNDYLQSGTATGAALQVSYALSKRTSIIGNYARWTQVETAAGTAGIVAGRDASSQYQMLVSHSF